MKSFVSPFPGSNRINILTRPFNRIGTLAVLVLYTYAENVFYKLYPLKIILTRYCQVFPFYTPCFNHWFSNVFRGYKKRTPGNNELIASETLSMRLTPSVPNIAKHILKENSPSDLVTARC